MLTKMRGAAILMTIVYLVVGGFVALVGVQMVPVYIDNYKVGKVLVNISQNSETKNEIFQSTNQKFTVFKILRKHFDLNNLANVPLKDLNVLGTSTGYRIQLKYARRKHLLGNVDVIMTFDQHIDLDK